MHRRPIKLHIINLLKQRGKPNRAHTKTLQIIDLLNDSLQVASPVFPPFHPSLVVKPLPIPAIPEPLPLFLVTRAVVKAIDNNEINQLLPEFGFTDKKCLCRRARNRHALLGLPVQS